jgi:Flp pilus assembly pilin Flp
MHLNNKGQGLVEYILIIAVVVGIIFSAYKIFGTKIEEQFQNATEQIQTADKE